MLLILKDFKILKSFLSDGFTNRRFRLFDRLTMMSVTQGTVPKINIKIILGQKDLFNSQQPIIETTTIDES